MREHEHEPVIGLPQRLPPGETVLWQGRPDWKSMAIRAFHLRKIAIYFLVLLALRALTVIQGGGSALDVLKSLLWLAPLAAMGLVMLAFVAWLTAWATLYTITNRRVVMRIGVVLSISFNFPFQAIASAGLRKYGNGTGDIPLALLGGDHIAYLHLWPHARPWCLAHPEPMLRTIPAASQVADILARALSESPGAIARPSPDKTVMQRPRGVRQPLIAAAR